MIETTVKKVKKTDATAREGAATSTASPDELGKELADILGKGKEDLTEADNKRIAELMNMKHPSEINLNAKDKYGATPMHQAAWEGRTDIVEALIKAGADKDAKDNILGNTPLHRAALWGETKTVQALIAAGADKEAKNEYGNTPMHRAAENGQTEIVRALIKAGADKEAKDNDGETPLHWAARYGETDIVQALIAARAEKEVKDNEGETPMHEAAKNGQTEIVQALIAAGADKEAKNEYGKTAADLLEEKIKYDRAVGVDVTALEATLKTLRPAEAEGKKVDAKPVRKRGGIKGKVRPNNSVSKPNEVNTAEVLRSVAKPVEEREGAFIPFERERRA